MFALVFFALIFSSAASAQGLYSISGKNVEMKDLSPAQQLQLFEIEYESYEKTKDLINGFILDNYLVEEAAKQKKSKDEVAKKVFEQKEPSEKEIKKWYEDNKSRIPPTYKFEQIKGEIGKMVQQEHLKEKRESILNKLKKDKKFSLTVQKPVSPKLDVKVDGFQSKGKDTAKVTVVEFADYQCPHCKIAAENLKKAVDKKKSDVRFIYIDYPLNPSGVSKAIAEASHCAAEQGKYWEFHYKAFADQSTLTNESGDKIAADLKLDLTKFKDCMTNGRGKAVVEKGKAEGERIGVSGTPFLLINGERYLGAHTSEAFIAAIEAYIK
jgi:protein-disulfide isomerase